MKLDIEMADGTTRTAEGAMLLYRVDGDGDLTVFGGHEGTEPLMTINRDRWISIGVAEGPPAGATFKRWAARQKAALE